MRRKFSEQSMVQKEGFSGSGWLEGTGNGIRGSVTVRANPNVEGAVKLHEIEFEPFLIGVKSYQKVFR